MVNLGRRPTFGGGTPALSKPTSSDFEGDLYGAAASGRPSWSGCATSGRSRVPEPWRSIRGDIAQDSDARAGPRAASFRSPRRNGYSRSGPKAPPMTELSVETRRTSTTSSSSIRAASSTPTPSACSRARSRRPSSKRRFKIVVNCAGPRLHRERGSRGDHGRDRGDPRRTAATSGSRSSTRRCANIFEILGFNHLYQIFPSEVEADPRASGTSRGPARLEGPGGRRRRRQDWRRRGAQGRPGSGPRAAGPHPRDSQRDGSSWPSFAMSPRRWPRPPASTRRKRIGWRSPWTRRRPTSSSTPTEGPRTARSRSDSTTQGPDLRVDVVDDGATGGPAVGARAWTSSAT